MLCFYSPVIVVRISLTHMRKINFFFTTKHAKQNKARNRGKKMERKKCSDEAPHTPLSLTFRISVSIDSGIKWKKKKNAFYWYHLHAYIYILYIHSIIFFAFGWMNKFHSVLSCHSVDFLLVLLVIHTNSRRRMAF